MRVGMEATGFSRLFERLLAELAFELWIGDPAEIKAKRVKKQKYDRETGRRRNAPARFRVSDCGRARQLQELACTEPCSAPFRSAGGFWSENAQR